jgi:periplasmic mercuric ion binding protein
VGTIILLGKERTMKVFGFIAAAALPLGGLAVVSAVASASPLAAAVQVRTATFAVGNMTCATCPISVKKAMSRVDGVQSVNVDLNSKTATVTFDPSKTNAAKIADASTGIGFPAKLSR